MTISVLHFSDPACPWAYSASPALSLLRWRFGAQLEWKLVLIGLSEDTARHAHAGYTALDQAQDQKRFRSYGMVFGGHPRERLAPSGRMCRAVVASRLIAPDHELAVFRALQVAQFTTTLVLDEDAGIRAALTRLEPAIDAAAIVAAIEDPEVEAAYQADRALARTAAGGPTEAQGRAANSDGAVRFTAPSLVFRTDDGRSLEAGGFQPVEAYDVCLANLEPALHRRPPAEQAIDVLHALPYAPTTREVATCMAAQLRAPDDDATEDALIAAVAAGLVVRENVGTGALWHLASPVAAQPAPDGTTAAASRA